MPPVRVHDVLREGRRDEESKHPRKDPTDGARREPGRDEEAVRRMIEDAAG